MSQWYCTYCDKHVYANEQDHADYELMMCEDCVDNYDPTPDDQGEPPIGWADYARGVKPR